MHGNPLYHWIALAVAGVLMLPRKASFDVVMTAMLFGIGFYGLAAVLFVLSAVKDNRARS